jgi:hypothetical protein
VISRTTLARPLAGAVVIVVLLGGCSDDPSRTAAASGPRSSTPTSGPATGAATDYRRLPHSDHRVPLEPGAWALTAIGTPGMPEAVFYVPRGYVAEGPFVFGDDPEPRSDHRILGYWTATFLYDNPCASTGTFDPGRTVRDLAEALGSQRFFTTTDARPVTLDGHQGLFLAMTGPKDLDYATCRDKDLELWESPPTGARYIAGPATDRIWIVDVDGDRVVVDIGTAADVPRHQVRALTAIAESVRFVAPD